MARHSIVSVAHDTWAQVLDGVSFGFINALQLRGKSGFHTLEEAQEYYGKHSDMPLGTYYEIPSGTPMLDLPESGSLRVRSPRECDVDENNWMHLDVWLGPKGWESPAMLMLHGHMSVSDVGYRMWAKKLNSLGWTALFFHLPYHYGRRPQGAMSGEMALSSNTIRTCEGIRQAVTELRWVCQTLKDRGAPHIGLWGTSYGGWVASLLILLEKSVSMAWLLEAIVDVDTAIWESPACITLRHQLMRRGMTREFLQPKTRLVCASHHQPIIPTDKVLLVSGTFDRVAPPETIRALHESWEGSVYAEYRQGHVGYQLMPKSLAMAQERFPEMFDPVDNK